MQGSSAGQWYGRRVQSLGQSWTKSGCSQARSDERAAPGPRLISTRFVTVRSRHSRTWAVGTAEAAGSQIPLRNPSCPFSPLLLVGPLPCAPCATLADPRDLPGAPGTLGWQATHSPGGPGQHLELVYLPPLAPPLAARLREAHAEDPRFPFPGFRSVLTPLHCLLASWKAGRWVIYKLVSSLTSLSCSAHYCSSGVSSPPPLAKSTPPASPVQRERLELAGACTKRGAGGGGGRSCCFPRAHPSSGTANVNADLWGDCTSNIMRY